MAKFHRLSSSSVVHTFTHRNTLLKLLNGKFLSNASQCYENMSVQYTAVFHGCKNVNFQMKNVIFSYFRSKH